MFTARFVLVATLRRLARTRIDLPSTSLTFTKLTSECARQTNNDVKYVCASKLTADSEYPIQTPLPRSNPIQKPHVQTLDIKKS